MKKGNEKESEEGKENEHENENEGGREKATEKKQAPVLMPYEIWGHITKDDWEAFVAKKTTPKEVVSI